MNHVKNFIQEEDAIGIVEIILILVILIGIVVIFREKIGKIVKDAFKLIVGDANSAMNKIEVD